MDLSPLGFPFGETPMDDIKGRIDVPTHFDELPKGICGTGDRFEVGLPKLECDLVDMEAYAIAKICRKWNVGFTAVKYITDGSDSNAKNDWHESLASAPQSLIQIYQQFTGAD
jgi:adenosylhomocysteine nucleosidase